MTRHRIDKHWNRIYECTNCQFSCKSDMQFTRHFKKSGTCKKEDHGKGTDHVDVGEAGSRTPNGEGVREGAIFPPTLSADGNGVRGGAENEAGSGGGRTRKDSNPTKKIYPK
ncbi:unnamed protein product [Orchesella dallaii]|uniref:C2H2-type domain-containing protein n=1 Tax=Orchesella dallaii TaxID=48710 RepID=A0ABP1Q8E2_9HEXA